MARQTDVRCDAKGCGYMDSAQGIEWVAVKAGKKKLDFCGIECLSGWVATQPKQPRLVE